MTAEPFDWAAAEAEANAPDNPDFCNVAGCGWHIFENGPCPKHANRAELEAHEVAALFEHDPALEAGMQKAVDELEAEALATHKQDRALFYGANETTIADMDAAATLDQGQRHDVAAVDACNSDDDE